MSTNTAAAPPESIFKNRFFQTVLLSNVLLQIGIWVRNFAILLFVTDKTNNDPISVSLISVVEFAPIFIFAFIGGTFADRWRPRRTMIWCDFLSAASVFVVLGSLMIGSWQLIYLATAVSAILSQFSQPSSMKLFKKHVPENQLQSAMALFQSLIGIFMVLGPSLGVFVYQTYGIEISIAIMGIAFLLSAVVLFRIPKDDKEEAAAAAGDKQFWKELTDGLRYVWKSKVLRPLGGTFALAGTAIGTIQSLGIFLVIERLDQSKDFLQYLLMVNGFAMLIGGGLIMAVAKKVQPQVILAAGTVVSAVTIAGMGISTNVTLTLVLQFLSGLMMPGIQIGISTMILKWTEPEYIGRVNGALSPMFMGMMVIMMSLSGVLKSAFPLVGIYIFAGFVMILCVPLLVPIFKLRPPGEEANAAAAEVNEAAR
ncbi:MFS transporter [Paenibacillus sp. NEAU-GSW1]|uniref:MFS transporter n=1 Tax=Paenibacillus sp. NEAU-GSW1 TaxID=2682486 RepID=UPI0012E32442|nr:MFS transporter [Paenibacillus sp. NEAU-GSW1]MUT67785.1 MFS transporter [Paenibacillus sp. NEAU-GSW1]